MLIDGINLVLGVVAGYCVASYIESYLHEHVSDARPRRVRSWRRFPRLLRPLINTHYSHHTIHHVKTWRRDHVTQFRSAEEKARLDELLSARGRHGKIIVEGDYATKLHNEGALVFTAPLLAACAVLFWLAPTHFAIGVCSTIFLPTFCSYFIHPFLHKPFEQGQREAPAFIAWLLRTRYFKMMYVNHFIHHRYGGTSNFNLVLGADRWRNKAREANQKDIEIMRRIGMPWDQLQVPARRP